MCSLKRLSLFSFRPSSSTPMTYDACDVETTNGAMDKTTGRFTAKIAGLYQFHFLGRVYGNASGHIWMMKGSTEIAMFGLNQHDSYYSFSGSVITQLDVGQQLYAKAQGGAKFYGSSSRPIIFQGFLLAEL